MSNKDDRKLSPEVKKWLDTVIELRPEPGDTWVVFQGRSSQGLHMLKTGSKAAREFKDVLITILLDNLADPERPDL